MYLLFNQISLHNKFAASNQIKYYLIHICKGCLHVDKGQNDVSVVRKFRVNFTKKLKLKFTDLKLNFAKNKMIPLISTHWIADFSGSIPQNLIESLGRQWFYINYNRQ